MDRQYQKYVGDFIIWSVLLTMPLWLHLVGGYTPLGTRVLIMALAAMALNFLLGYTGVLSFGHAAYFGLGAYGAGLTIKYLIPNTLAGMGVGLIVGIVAAAIIGLLIIRLRGIYFAMVTISFGQVFYFIAFRWNSVTGGDNGLTFQRQPIHLGFTDISLSSGVAYYYLALAVFAVCTAAMAIILRSPFGHTLLAMRENERRARFLSIPVNRHLWIAYTISCMFAAVAGSLYGMLNNFVSPHDLHWTQSGDFVLMAVIGGMRSFWGPLLGAAIFVALQDYLSSLTDNWMFFIGVIFVLVVLFIPRGFVGLLQRKTS